MKGYASCLVCTTCLSNLVLAAAVRYEFPVDTLWISYVFCIAVIFTVLMLQTKKEQNEEMLYYKEKAIKILLFTFLAFIVFLFCKKYDFVQVLIGVLGIAAFSLLAAFFKKDKNF